MMKARFGMQRIATNLFTMHARLSQKECKGKKKEKTLLEREESAVLQHLLSKKSGNSQPLSLDRPLINHVLLNQS